MAQACFCVFDKNIYQSIKSKDETDRYSIANIKTSKYEANVFIGTACRMKKRGDSWYPRWNIALGVSTKHAI